MKKRSNLLRRVYTVLDVVLIVLSYYLSERLWIVIFSKGDNFLMHKDMRSYVFCGVLIYALIILIISSATGLYKSFRYNSIWKIWIKGLLIHVIVLGAFTVSLYVLHIQHISRGVLFTFFAITAITTLIKHFIAIGALKAARASGYNQKHVILVGSGSIASEYANTVNRNKRYGITVFGYISDSPNDEKSELGKYLGGYDALEENIHDAGIDEVIVALENPETDKVFSVIERCDNSGTRISIIPYYNNMISPVPSINMVGKLKCFNLRKSPLDIAFNRLVKRLFDIVFSLFVVVLTSPLMLIVALGVKLSSPGSVFFKQVRIGVDKKVFTMYKFRSMKVNDSSDTAWSSDVDPRRTKFGSFIRKTSIDELPQFFNVLKGDMSVIGPRPEIPHYVEYFRDTIPQYMLKHLVRPGITGWAQVNGYRGDTSIEERIKHDIWYIENWTFGLDVKILFRTVFGGMINNEKSKHNQQ